MPYQLKSVKSQVKGFDTDFNATYILCVRSFKTVNVSFKSKYVANPYFDCYIHKGAILLSRKCLKCTIMHVITNQKSKRTVVLLFCITRTWTNVVFVAKILPFVIDKTSIKKSGTESVCAFILFMIVKQSVISKVERGALAKGYFTIQPTKRITCGQAQSKPQ